MRISIDHISITYHYHTPQSSHLRFIVVLIILTLFTLAHISPYHTQSHPITTTRPFVTDHRYMQLIHTSYDDLLSPLTNAFLCTLRRESSKIVVAPGEVYFRDEYYCPRTGEKQVTITTDLATNVEGPSVRTFRIEFFYDPLP
jgi:hypothetical protein